MTTPREKGLKTGDKIAFADCHQPRTLEEKHLDVDYMLPFYKWTDNIFVFGSNLAGRHGKGAALTAIKQHGAEYGVGRGLTGHNYAIPTKDEKLRVRSLSDVGDDILEFLQFAQSKPNWTFYVTPIGTGLAGFTFDEICPYFDNAPDNCIFAKTWQKLPLNARVEI